VVGRTTLGTGLNMGINIIDRSGEPRSDEDIQEAIDAVTREMVSRNPGNPELMVMFPTIIESLNELLRLREFIKKAIKSNIVEEGGG